MQFESSFRRMRRRSAAILRLDHRDGSPHSRNTEFRTAKVRIIRTRKRICAYARVYGTKTQRIRAAGRPALGIDEHARRRLPATGAAGHSRTAASAGSEEPRCRCDSMPAIPARTARRNTPSRFRDRDRRYSGKAVHPDTAPIGNKIHEAVHAPPTSAPDPERRTSALRERFDGRRIRRIQRRRNGPRHLESGRTGMAGTKRSGCGGPVPNYRLAAAADFGAII